jgi:hypothetical protein
MRLLVVLSVLVGINEVLKIKRRNNSLGITVPSHAGWEEWIIKFEEKLN